MKMNIQLLILLFAFVALSQLSCEKGNNNPVINVPETKTYSSEVAVKWINLQLNMLRVPLAPSTGSPSAERAQAYCGITLYESVVNGMPFYQSLNGQLTNFPTMPVVEMDKQYHWAACANAALASINRSLFPTTSAANKASIDSLENALKAQFSLQVDSSTINRSVSFGKDVASRVAAWAATDGSANVNPPYVPPVGPGLWVPTATTPPINPYASQRRLLVPGSDDGTALAPPPVYSTDPSSAFYAMVKDVYDKSLVLTPDQIAMAVYHRDAPGYPGGGHFVSILSQVITKAYTQLDVAAMAYVKVGLSQHDATIVLFKNKYSYNLIRPVTYIQTIMGHPTWQTVIPTPNHPEFPSGHAVTSSAVIVMLNDIFGQNFQITLHTYDYLGFPPRSYSSFNAMGKEMSDSRIYGGLHYQATCDKSTLQGQKVAQNILSKVKFSK